MATRPPIVSHTGVLGVFEHWRNIDDEQLRAVADKGGVVGVIFCPKFLGGDGLEPVVQHLKHILDVCGRGRARRSAPTGTASSCRRRSSATPRTCPCSPTRCWRRGSRRRPIGKILRGNALRVLDDA